MARGRCRYYDDDGNPIGGGCTRQGIACDFTHPSEPGWTSAPRAMMGSSSDFRGRGRGRGRGGRGGSGGAWGPSDDSGYTSWSGPPTASTASSGRGGKQQQSDSSSSAWNAWQGPAESNNGANNGWGDGKSTWGKDDGINSGSSWAADGGNDRADDNGGGWGNSEGWGASSGGGWGGDTNNSDTQARPNEFASSSTEIASHPEVTRASPWSQDIHTSEPHASTSRAAPSAAPVAHQNGSKWIPVAQEPSRVEINHKKHKAQYANQLSSQNDVAVDEHRRGTVEEPSPVPSASSAGLSSSMPKINDPSLTLKSLLKKVPDNLSAKYQLWREVITLFTQSVTAELKLKNAEQRRDQWKRTQASYNRIGLAARDKLNAVRREFDIDILACKKEINNYVKAFVQLPDKSSATVELELALGEHAKDAERYTAELKDWIGDIRPLLLEITQQQNAKEAPLEEGQIEHDLDVRPTKRQRLSLDDEGSNSLGGLSLLLRLDGLEERLSNLENNPLAEYTTLLDSVDTAIEDKHAAMSTATPAGPIEDGEMYSSATQVAEGAEEGEYTAPTYEVPKKTDRAAELTEAVQGLGDKVAVEAERVALIYTACHTSEKKLEKLKIETEENRAKMDRELTKMKNMIQENTNTMNKMSEQMQVILNRSKLSQSFVPEKLVADLAPTVHDVVLKDIQPTLDCLHAAYTAQINVHHQELYGRVWGQLQPTLQIATGVHEWIEMEEGKSGLKNKHLDRT